MTTTPQAVETLVGRLMDAIARMPTEVSKTYDEMGATLAEIRRLKGRAACNEALVEFWDKYPTQAADLCSYAVIVTSTVIDLRRMAAEVVL